MQVVKYQIIKNILIVGFKINNFVVYSQIPYNNTKQYMLQKAYEQVKNTIDYENTLTEHSFTTDEIGEEFIPEIPTASKIIIDNAINYFSCLQVGSLTRRFTAKVYDQYGNLIAGTVVFTLNVTPLNITLLDGLLTVGQADSDYDLALTASCGNATDTLQVYIKKYVEPIIPPKTIVEVNTERITAMEDAVMALMDASML